MWKICIAFVRISAHLRRLCLERLSDGIGEPNKQASKRCSLIVAPFLCYMLKNLSLIGANFLGKCVACIGKLKLYTAAIERRSTPHHISILDRIRNKTACRGWLNRKVVRNRANRHFLLHPVVCGFNRLHNKNTRKFNRTDMLSNAAGRNANFAEQPTKAEQCLGSLSKHSI